MELTIDNRRCDLGTDPIRLPAYEAARLADPEACRTGRSLQVTLPDTPRNRAIANEANDPQAYPRFNRTLHQALLTHEGATLFRGSVRLLSHSDEGYTFELREGGDEWARQAALRRIDDLAIDYTTELTPTAVCASWTAAEAPVRFFPVHRDAYPFAYNPSDLLPAQRMLSVDDYRPFLHLRTLVERIFAEAGYRIESDFLDSAFFRSLYLSGAYRAHDTAAAEARMGFRASRLGSATAAAGPTGRVYADPDALYNTVGNIVDTAKPQSLDDDGEPIEEVYNNGGCFLTDNGRICFRPTTSLPVGFDYRLRYTTDHRIESRTRLKGFDSIYLGAGAEWRFELANRYVDRRQEIAPNHRYRVLVFNHTAGARYRLTYDRNGLSQTVWREFSARSAEVTTPTAGTVANPVLWVASGSTWVRYTGDWALYDGYIGETGQTVVEVRLRTPAEALTPDSPKYFNRIYLYGAEEGMTLTLHKECSVQAVFQSGPAFGSSIRFADVARLPVRQSELLQAVAHLFNLRFWSDREARTVRIEPEVSFFADGPEVDWSDRTDFSQPVERQEIAPGIHERRTWCYRAGDGPVRRYEAEHETTIGSWSYDALSQATLAGEEVLRNPLLAPTLSAAGDNLNAPSALLMQIGDRDDLSAGGEDFTPRIVRYAGLHPLPADEVWGSPANGQGYPLAAFHFAGDEAAAGFTLGFENRDGLTGLNRFWRRQAEREGSLEQITLTLRLAPHEYEALFLPDTGAPNLRSCFRIETGRGSLRATLSRIAPYDPLAGTARCTFDRLPQ